MRRVSVISSSSSSSSYSSDDASVYEAELFIDDQSIVDAAAFDTHALGKDDTSKLFPTTTNGSVATTTTAYTHARSSIDGSRHPAPSAAIAVPGAGTDDASSAAHAESCTSHGNGNGTLLAGGGSPTISTSLPRNIDYSEYTYDLGWTAATRMHSRNSSLAQPVYAPSVAEGFASPNFVAARAAAANDTDSIVSQVRIDGSPHVVAAAAAAMTAAAGVPTADDYDIYGSDFKDASGDILSCSPNSLVQPSMEAMSEYADSADLASLIDYASPRVPPFPSTAEAEELLYSRMPAHSRAALHKLMHGRNPSVPRPPRFRPPISQNMGYGAIQRHPFYHASTRSGSRSSSMAHSAHSVDQPRRMSQPAYRRLHRSLGGGGNDEFEDNVGLWESLRSFFLAEFCFCCESSEDE
ncbi:uncharacterized protein V1518DRAFT_371859 [Limtongia smithiae]|uniref:uncharacterized protein n=1 Tax=Limtongia smithiae TaxID=1125753 RepID=UPI0034CD725E